MTHLPSSISGHLRPPSPRRAPPRYGQGRQEVRKPGKAPRIAAESATSFRRDQNLRGTQRFRTL